jgi:hypothetical protein
MLERKKKRRKRRRERSTRWMNVELSETESMRGV